MSNQRVLRIKRSDVEGDADAFIILNITTVGESPLDLRLVGTEGESPYVGAIKRSQLNGLRAKQYQGSKEEWEAVVDAVFVQGTTEDDQSKATEGLEVVSSLSGDQMQIAIRKNIAGITQRLGTITLKREDEEEISLFEWTAIAAQSSSAAKKQVAELNSKFEAQKDMVNKLNEQLEELVRAKEEHENALLEKFTRLLNAKKLKIRDQQRLLAMAKVDPKAAADVSSARRDTQPRKAAPSRKSKRKAESSVSPTKDAVDDDDDDRMNIDKPANEDDDDSAAADEQREREEEGLELVTPQPSDLEETEDDEAGVQSPESGVGAKGKAIESVTSPVRAAPDEEPPPKRELPFARRQQQAATDQSRAAVKQSEAMDEDETDDDEL